MTVYRVPDLVVKRTFELFRQCGEGRRECQAIWTSSWDSPETITEVGHPAHRPHGDGFIVEDRWLNAFWIELASAGKGIRVQVHTHPGRAFHSPTDDQYPIIHAVGFLSLVIPDYGLGDVGFDRAYLAEIGPDGRWRKVDIASRLAGC